MCSGNCLYSGEQIPLTTATFLAGDNLSGRSAWLAERRRAQQWPDAAYLGPYPELACTGLALTVDEELKIAGRSGSSSRKQTLIHSLQLEALSDNRIYTLSGGETVRLALSSVVAQDVGELHIDIALEQLDSNWRSRVFDMLKAIDGFAERQFVADNHSSADEILGFAAVLNFPDRASEQERQLQEIDCMGAASLLYKGEMVSISLSEVAFGYPRSSHSVFRDATASLNPGVLHILSGPNGSGKTTLVKLLSGTLLPRSGIIKYGGHQFRAARSAERFAGCAFQNPDFQWTDLTVATHLMIASKTSELASDILTWFGIPPAMANESPNDLPFIFKKRLGIASAFATRKPWLVFDEPTLGQDKRFAASLAECFRMALRNGIGIILISHDAQFKSLFPNSNEVRIEAGHIVSMRTA